MSYQNIAELLRRTTKRYPTKTAIRCGAVEWSYAEFDALCDSLAAGLHHNGIVKGSRVAVLARNSHAFAAMRFALARLGAVIVPINLMLKAEEVAYILRHSQVRTLAADGGLMAIGREAAALDTQVEQYISLPGEMSPEPEGDALSFAQLLTTVGTAPTIEVAGGDLAQIIYTSGTESLPKGAMLTHEAVIWQYVTCIVDGEIASGDLILHSLPLYHCAQLDCFLGPGVYLGATNVITSAPTPDNLLALIGQSRVTSFFAPPTVWISLLRSTRFDHSDLSSLRKGYYGASIMPVEVLREMQQRLPQVRLWNFYGQTEIAPLAAVLKPEDQQRKPGSIGKPALNIETRVVDDQMRDVAPGEIGEIVHRSPQLLVGYLNDPERTAAAFDGGWFHSGDLAVVDDEGYMSVVDRKKDMIKTGGENVASREVEEVIYGLQQVSEVAVIGLPHPRWVEAVMAVIVIKEGQTLSAEEVVDFCSKRMANFKVPKGVAIVQALPKSPSGKLLKRELRKQFEDRFGA